MSPPKKMTTLLLVEDNAGDARLLREMFNEQGSENLDVTYVKSMGEAEKFLAEHIVDVIVLDLGLPDVQGLEAVQRAQAAAPCVPLVVMTGRDDESLATLTLQEGAQDYLVKGQIDSRGLLRALRYAIERKNLEEARKSAEARVRLQSVALNAADNAMVIADRDLSIVWVNPAFTELTGYTDEEAIGGNVLDLLRSGLHDQAFYDSIANTIQGGESWRGEMTNRRKDGRLYPEAQTITPVKDDDGTIRHFISIKTDLTAQRLMEAKIRHGQKMEAVGQLAAGVAHEFNNLLQALMSMAAIVRLRGGTPEVARVGTEMEFQIKRGASLTQQLLLFSRHHALAKSALDLAEQVQKAGLLLRRLIQENIRMVVETPPERLSAEGDPEQIQQVILNLAINARDAMPGGGTLTLRAGSSEGEVFLEVEDTGHGLDEATRAHLFEPFFTTKELGKGTGLGLAVVHGIVEQHGGRIEVQSRPGEGSRFRIILPATAHAARPAAESNIEPDEPSGSGHVLLVEDEDMVRAGISALLEILGYEVTAVGSGEEAMALSLDPAPDLLLSDLTLPGMTGSALAAQLLERWPALKVVLMSGYLEETKRANAIDRGWHFLQKPFEMANLTSHLREALGGRISATTATQPSAIGDGSLAQQEPAPHSATSRTRRA